RSEASTAPFVTPSTTTAPASPPRSGSGSSSPASAAGKARRPARPAQASVSRSRVAWRAASAARSRREPTVTAAASSSPCPEAECSGRAGSGGVQVDAARHRRCARRRRPGRLLLLAFLAVRRDRTSARRPQPATTGGVSQVRLLPRLFDEGHRLTSGENPGHPRRRRRRDRRRRGAAHERDRREQSMKTGIHLHGLCKTFHAGGQRIEAVRDLDLSIGRGETVALLGPNGAGKSTTIDILLGLLAPDLGSVSIFGRSPAQAIAEGAVGAMLQTGGLLRDLTVRELVTMLASLYPRPLPVDDVLGLTGTTHLATQRTQKLSGGETQRVRFALALVANPQLLVLDEPTVAMDVEARRDFWTTMRSFAAGGRTILFATHYLEEAEAYADRAVLMARGRVVADGPTTEIKAMVATRTIEATLPHAPVDSLERLQGVARAEQRGARIVLACADSDAAIRALLAAFPDARDIEIRGAGLEEAFLQLTQDRDSRQEAAA